MFKFPFRKFEIVRFFYNKGQQPMVVQSINRRTSLGALAIITTISYIEWKLTNAKEEDWEYDSLEEAAETLQQLIATKGFQEGTSYETINQVGKLLTHSMATEIVKITGSEYFVDVLKAQNNWQVESLQFLNKILLHSQWRDELSNTNLLPYLIRNMAKVEYIAPSMEEKEKTAHAHQLLIIQYPIEHAYIDLIHQLVQNPQNINSLFKEMKLKEIFTLIEDQPANIRHSVGAALLLELRRSPLFVEEASSSKLVSFIDGKYYINKLKSNCFKGPETNRKYYRELLTKCADSLQYKEELTVIKKLKAFLLPDSRQKMLVSADDEKVITHLNETLKELTTSKKRLQDIIPSIFTPGSTPNLCIAFMWIPFAWKAKVMLKYSPKISAVMSTLPLALFSALGFCFILSTTNSINSEKLKILDPGHFSGTGFEEKKKIREFLEFMDFSFRIGAFYIFPHTFFSWFLWKHIDKLPVSIRSKNKE